MTADRGLGAAAVLIATVAILAALRVASSVFAPIVFALFIMALVWPLQSRLQARLPKLIALALVILATVVTFVAFASLVAWGFGRAARWLVNDAARLQSLYEQAVLWLEGHGVAVAEVWAEHFNMGWLVRAVQEITRRVNATMSFWLVVLVYLILGLLEVEDACRRVRAIKNPEAARILLGGSLATAAKFRRYMLVRTLMSVLTGSLVWAFAALAGLQLAAEWGVIAFALNYIPFIGPLIAMVFPTLFAAVQFGSWQAALAMFLGFNVIQFVVGSYLEPQVSGSALAVSPFVVLFAVFFWMFLWGLLGAFIGVPIVIALLTFCAQHPASRWLADLFGASGGRPAADEPR